jgi:hypothetical protein
MTIENVASDLTPASVAGLTLADLGDDREISPAVRAAIAEHRRRNPGATHSDAIAALKSELLAARRRLGEASDVELESFLEGKRLAADAAARVENTIERIRGGSREIAIAELISPSSDRVLYTRGLESLAGLSAEDAVETALELRRQERRTLAAARVRRQDTDVQLVEELALLMADPVYGPLVELWAAAATSDDLTKKIVGEGLLRLLGMYPIRAHNPKVLSWVVLPRALSLRLGVIAAGAEPDAAGFESRGPYTPSFAKKAGGLLGLLGGRNE